MSFVKREARWITIHVVYIHNVNDPGLTASSVKSPSDMR